jgi:hypothetical protein
LDASDVSAMMALISIWALLVLIETTYQATLYTLLAINLCQLSSPLEHEHWTPVTTNGSLCPRAKRTTNNLTYLTKHACWRRAPTGDRSHWKLPYYGRWKIWCTADRRQAGWVVVEGEEKDGAKRFVQLAVGTYIGTHTYLVNLM